MDKRVTMQARFDVQTITGEPLKDLLNDEIHYVDIGPFEIETGGRLIPFDFESISIDFDNDSACIFCCFTGLEERMSDVDMHHEVSWAAAGLERKDITAALLADADALTKFHFAAGGYGIPRIPCSLKLKAMTFTDEHDNTYAVKHDVLDNMK